MKRNPNKLILRKEDKINIKKYIIFDFYSKIFLLCIVWLAYSCKEVQKPKIYVG